jgi:hypothetical protein
VALKPEVSPRERVHLGGGEVDGPPQGVSLGRKLLDIARGVVRGHALQASAAGPFVHREIHGDGLVDSRRAARVAR